MTVEERFERLTPDNKALVISAIEVLIQQQEEARRR